LKTENKIAIENRNLGYLTMFLGAWLLGWCVITGVLVYALLFDNNGRYSFLFTILSVLFIIGYLLWNQFLWNLRGKHELTFFKNHLMIEKVGTISIFSKRIFDYNELIRFDTTKSRKRTFIADLWGFGGESLVGICTIRCFYCGAGWNLTDSKVLANKLNEILEEKKIP
jgi:hypothetical protein